MARRVGDLPVFVNVPDVMIVAPYTLIPDHAYGAVLSQRVRNWWATFDNRATTPKNEAPPQGLPCRRLMPQTLGDLLRRASCTDDLLGFLRRWSPPSRSTTSCPRAPSSSTARPNQAYSRWATLPAFPAVGIVWAIVRRYLARPHRIRIKRPPEHAVILGVFS